MNIVSPLGLEGQDLRLSLITCEHNQPGEQPHLGHFVYESITGDRAMGDYLVDGTWDVDIIATAYTRGLKDGKAEALELADKSMSNIDFANLDPNNLPPGIKIIPIQDKDLKNRIQDMMRGEKPLSEPDPDATDRRGGYL